VEEQQKQQPIDQESKWFEMVQGEREKGWQQGQEQQQGQRQKQRQERRSGQENGQW
jgi:hypothetical protein